MEKSLKNYQVLDLLNNGFAEVTALTLEPAHAYKVGKFRRAIIASYQATQEERKAILKDLGIEDAQAFDKESQEIFKGEDEGKKKERVELLGKLNAQVGELMNEDAKVEARAIPFEEWLKLRKENSSKEIGGKTQDIIPNHIEDLLLGILWNEPQED